MHNNKKTLIFGFLLVNYNTLPRPLAAETGAGGAS